MENNAFAQKIYFKGFNERKINYLKFDEHSENISISNNSSNIPMRNISNNNERMQIGKLNVQNINSNTNLTHQGSKTMNFENEYINSSTQNTQNFNAVHGNSGYSNSQLLFLNKNMNSNNSINPSINNIGNLNNMYNFNKNLKSNDILKDNILNKNMYNDFKHGDNKMDFNNLNMKSFTKSRNMNIHNVNSNSNINGNTKLILHDLNSDHIDVGNKNNINDSYINSYKLNINTGNIPGNHQHINNYDSNVMDKGTKTDAIYNSENNNMNNNNNNMNNNNNNMNNNNNNMNNNNNNMNSNNNNMNSNNNNMNSDNIYLSGQTNNTLNRNNIKNNLNNFLNTNILMNKHRNKFTSENTLNSFNSTNNELIGNNNNNQKNKNAHLKMYENDNIQIFKGIESNNDLIINHMNQEMLGNNFNTHTSNSNIGGNNMTQLANIGNTPGNLASYNRPNTHNVNIMNNNNNNIGNNTLNNVMHNQIANQISGHLTNPNMKNMTNSNNMHVIDTDISNFNKNILLKQTNVNNTGSHSNINNYNNTNISHIQQNVSKFSKMNNMYNDIVTGINNVENNKVNVRGNLINFEYLNDKDNINELQKNMILNDSSSNIKNFSINNGNMDFLNNKNGIDMVNNVNNFNNVNNNNQINYVPEIQNFGNTCSNISSTNINYNMLNTIRDGGNEIKINEQIISKNIEIPKKSGVGNTIQNISSNNIITTDNYANLLKQICTPIKNRTDNTANSVSDNLIVKDFGDSSNEYGPNAGNMVAGIDCDSLTTKQNNSNSNSNSNEEREIQSNYILTGKYNNPNNNNNNNSSNNNNNSSSNNSNIYELKKLNLYAENKKKKENEKNDEKTFKNNIKKNKTKVFFYINPKYIIEPLKRKIYQNMSVFIENLISDIQKIENKNRAEILENLHNTPWFCMIFDFDGISKLLNVFNKYLIYSDSLIIPDILMSTKLNNGNLPGINSGVSSRNDIVNSTCVNNEKSEIDEEKHFEENGNENNVVNKSGSDINNEYMQSFNFYFEKSNKFDILNKKIYDYENNIIENVEKLNYLKDLCRSLKSQVDLKKKKFLLLFEKAKLKNYIYKNKDLQTILDIEKKLAINVEQPKTNNEYYTVFKKINDGLNYLKKYSNIIILNNSMYNDILNEQESGNFCESSISTDELAHEENLNDDIDNNNPDEDINNMNISPSNQINKRNNDNQNQNNNDDNLFFKNKNATLKDYEQDKEVNKKRKTINQIKNLQWEKEENEEWVDDFLEDF
ncbi:conserved Plasmodium protein, unknown function [Plasmodium berghei]|uniref:Asparagine-rich protein n=1 Tax=Plasmodium berghei TaxID=5821 RepID=A0A1D3S6G2_PLABE|nr:conserved Plasmodium protein, unknown function [Plasmodium berghei]